MFLRVEIPPLPEYKVRELGLEDVKACWWISRPAYLLVKGKIKDETLLTPVYEGVYSLYKGSISIVYYVKEKIENGEIQITPVSEKPTEKQRKLIEELSKELNVAVDIPETRKQASIVIQKLLSLKRRKQKIKQKQKAF